MYGQCITLNKIERLNNIPDKILKPRMSLSFVACLSFDFKRNSNGRKMRLDVPTPNMMNADAPGQCINLKMIPKIIAAAEHVPLSIIVFFMA